MLRLAARKEKKNCNNECLTWALGRQHGGPKHFECPTCSAKYASQRQENMSRPTMFEFQYLPC